MSKPFSGRAASRSRDENASKSPGLDLFRFAPFRLNRLAAEVSSALSIEYRERYGLDIPEWRVLATLGFRNDACSAQYISHCTRTHKSTISRAVTALMARQLIEIAQATVPGIKIFAFTLLFFSSSSRCLFSVSSFASG